MRRRRRQGVFIENQPKSISKEDFFKKVAINARVTDLETVRNIYYGMIRTVSQELRFRRIISLPDWGEFYIHIQKEKRFLNFQTNEWEYMPKKPQIKWNTMSKMKDFFYSIKFEE